MFTVTPHEHECLYPCYFVSNLLPLRVAALIPTTPFSLGPRLQGWRAALANDFLLGLKLAPTLSLFRKVEAVWSAYILAKPLPIHGYSWKLLTAQTHGGLG